MIFVSPTVRCTATTPSSSARPRKVRITDLSGKRATACVSNGARMAQARMVDGDVIELGRMKLKFESAPA